MTTDLSPGLRTTIPVRPPLQHLAVGFAGVIAVLQLLVSERPRRGARP